MNEEKTLAATQQIISELEYIQQKTNEINLRLSKEANLTGQIPSHKFQQAQKAIQISRAIAYDRILISEGIDKVK